MTTLMALIDSLADEPERPAILSLTGEGIRTLSRGELHAEVRRLAGGLAARVRPGEAVGLFAAESGQWVIAALAAIRAGALVVPMDVQASAEIVAHMLADSEAKMTFTTRQLSDRLTTSRVPLVLLDSAPEDSQACQALAAEGPLPETAPSDGAVLFYTSGTTGPPKGVPLTHANLRFQIDTIVATGMLSLRDRLAVPLPLHHVYPFVIGMLLPISLGVPLILPQTLTGPQVMRALREGEATAMVGVPRLYSALYEAIEARVSTRSEMTAALFSALLSTSVWARRQWGVYWGRRLFKQLHRQLAPNLRLLACGGAAIDPDLAWRLEGLGWQMAIGYGLTETAPLLTMNLPPSPRLDSVGRPLPGVRIRIDAPPGREGEILAMGPNVFGGYHNLPEKTRQVFTPEGWFRTGDLGRMEDEWLIITGRVKELIVTPGGENIQPEEVERVFCAHPFIQEFALLEKGGCLVGLVFPEPVEIRRAGRDDVAEAVREAVKEVNRRLPSYQRIVDFAVTRDPLPRTRLGKLRRHELPSRFSEAKCGGENVKGSLPVERMAEADRRLLEEPRLHQVWEWLGQRYPDCHLTPATSLRLDLGLDSLSWLELTLDIQRLTGIEIDAETIARIETVRDLLTVIQQAPKGSHVIAWETPQSVLTHEDLERLRPLQGVRRMVFRSLAHLDHALMRGLFRLKVRGLEHLPAGQCVIAPNHVSLLDPFAVAAALPLDFLERTCWAGWTGIAFSNPVVGFFSRLARVLPIDPEREVLKSLALSLAALQQGNHLVVFPEGRRSVSGRLQPLRPGLGMLLSRYPVPVVPVHVEGTFTALPVGQRVPRLVAIEVKFGKPFDTREFPGKDKEAAAVQITRAIHERLATLAVEAQED